MSRDWTKEELNTASEVMKQNGYMGYEEFCQALEKKQSVGFDLGERSRKELVGDISEILGEKAEYMKMPTCAYQIGNYTLAKDSLLTWSADTADSDTELLLQKLKEKGWNMIFTISTDSEEEPELLDRESEFTELDVDSETTEESNNAPLPESETATTDFCIELPTDALTDTAVMNLNRIIESKGNLMMKAIGAENLTYEITPEKIRFPWFHFSGSPEEATAYTQLITALVKMANDSKRITAKEHTVENEKYAFRCFLLRLGFIGDEYKASRKILLKNLNGNSAFRDKK